MGIPVICTEIGFEGLGVESGEGVFKETDPLHFAQRAIRLLKEEDLRATTGQKAVEIIKNKFSWEQIARQLAHYLDPNYEN